MRVQANRRTTKRLAVAATVAAALATTTMVTAPTASADSRRGCDWPRVCFYLTSSDWDNDDRRNVSVEFRVKLPAGVKLDAHTVNGGIELSGLKGRINAETTNGGIKARDVSGSIEASTTNGGVDVELAELAESGVKLGCTNGGIELRLPSDSKATISARVTNGGIDTAGLPIETTGESNRRRLDGRLNGGGARVNIEGTNGGIRIRGR